MFFPWHAHTRESEHPSRSRTRRQCRGRHHLANTPCRARRSPSPDRRKRVAEWFEHACERDQLRHIDDSLDTIIKGHMKSMPGKRLCGYHVSQHVNYSNGAMRFSGCCCRAKFQSSSKEAVGIRVPRHAKGPHMLAWSPTRRTTALAFRPPAQLKPRAVDSVATLNAHQRLADDA